MPQHPRTLAAAAGLEPAQFGDFHASLLGEGCRGGRQARRRRAAAAAGTAAMPLRDARFVAAALIAFLGHARQGLHQSETWRRHHPRGGPAAKRAEGAIVALGDAAVEGEFSAVPTVVVVKGHGSCCGSRLGRSQDTRARSILPSRYFLGPDEFGRMSNEKISVGTYSVAQALGMSTMPLMWPSTGAVPRIA